MIFVCLTLAFGNWARTVHFPLLPLQPKRFIPLTEIYPSMFSFHLFSSKSFLHSFSIKMMSRKSKITLKINLRSFFQYFFCYCFALLPFPSHFMVWISSITRFLNNFLFVFYDNFATEVLTTLLHPK